MKKIILAALALAGCGREDIYSHGMHAIDGDTIRVQGERIRLAGIDAPEMPGHCRRGRQCVQGDPYAAQAALQMMLDGGAYCVGNRGARDVYGRLLVTCWLGGQRTNVNLWLVQSGFAEPYRPPRPQP